MYDENMRYVVSQQGEGATDAVEAASAREAAEVFVLREYETWRHEFPASGITVVVRDEQKTVTRWHAKLDWSSTFNASEAA